MGSFVLKRVKIKNAKDGYMFNLYAANHLIVATSQIYTSLAVCKKGVQSVIRNATVAETEDQTEEGFEVRKNPKFELYLDAGGQFRFRLRATNGEKILASQGYTNKVNCKKGIQSVRTNVVNPRFFMEDGDETVELTLNTGRGISDTPVSDTADMVLFTDRPLTEDQPMVKREDAAQASEEVSAVSGSEAAMAPAPTPPESPRKPNAAEASTGTQKKKGFFARLFSGRK